MAPKRPVNGAATPPASKPSSSSVTATTTTKTATPVAFTTKSPPQDIILGIWQRYLVQTSQRTKMLDAFMAFLVLVGGVQFVYCVLAGNYPFNAFLSGFSAAVGQFVLTASLRMQTSGQDAKGTSKTKSSSSKGSATPAQGDLALDAVSPERAFADYVFGSVILHFFCVNFIN
ncbi:oligosaccharyl transferase subunit Dad1 [Coccidioides immitis RS]|uniref:Dolichyl-diphosphooligosaccharide--protein glycosyltransferase subunit OST2 n=1 Tax=Coccidioides immitis (strain RS) TaxID=246410 RepID=A0A0E1S3E4_COCIM|nr:oligosaccharyl transferase subunit Dad1 [Coccidioides immitis RS]EAS33596.1 oligosaccharyl transferase subunit Dad1 [Coccidioides immitis RS]TPX21273.1 oligosaccharyltransferase complex subunit epsilon [Coccidioides immitis]